MRRHLNVPLHNDASVKMYRGGVYREREGVYTHREEEYTEGRGILRGKGIHREEEYT